MIKTLLLVSLLALLPMAPLQAEEGEAEKKNLPKKAMYHKIADRFVVNIQEGSKKRFMQVKVQVMTRNEQVSAAVENNLPALSHAMIMLLSHQDGATMRNLQSRETVRQQALVDLQKVLSEVAGISEGLEAVYFTDFVIQ